MAAPSSQGFVPRLSLSSPADPTPVVEWITNGVVCKVLIRRWASIIQRKARASYAYRAKTFETRSKRCCHFGYEGGLQPLDVAAAFRLRISISTDNLYERSTAGLTSLMSLSYRKTHARWFTPARLMAAPWVWVHTSEGTKRCRRRVVSLECRHIAPRNQRRRRNPSLTTHSTQDIG